MEVITELTAEYREHYDGHVWVRSVKLLLDGVESLADIGSGGYIGLEPADLVLQQQLVDPSNLPTEVTLYRCDCGELGCGAVVARCCRDGDTVVWDDFGAGNPPPRHLDGPRHAPDAVRFDGDAYGRTMGLINELAERHG